MSRSTATTCWLVGLLCWTCSFQASASAPETFKPTDAPLDFSTPEARAEIEEFLRSAKVKERRALGEGITESSRFVLQRDGMTTRALWKTIDESVPIQRFVHAKPEMRFKDSYLHEIAAYELDKLLGLGMVPPAVERHIGRSVGCLQLWLEGTITDTERRKRSISPPRMEEWNQQMFVVRLFHQLIDDTDYNNISNLLIDGDFKIYIIDSSRAFRYNRVLRKPESLQRFSRSLLESLRRLDPALVHKSLGKWLSKDQINAMLARRDLIIAHADARVAEFGESGVLYP